jgi:type IV secretory pathway VirB2 component (pilin)
VTGFEADFRARRGWQRFLPAVALLCLVLVAMLAVAQVAHVHQNQTDADHCQLCVVMHTVVPVAALSAVIEIVRMGVFAPRAEPVSVVWRRQCRLFIRPPPSSC